MPKVSVIIPAYNAEEFIRKAIDSVLAQTFRDIEVIVVDDGSTDNTLNILRAYFGKISVLSQMNGGPSRARNSGIRYARGEYVAFLDSDDYWAPKKLESQLEVIFTDPIVKFVNCSAYNIDSSGNVLRISLKPWYSQECLIKELYINNAVGNLPGWLIARECFDTIGFFDESLLVAEDWDLAIRICKRYKYHCVQEPLIYVRDRQNSQSFYAQKNLENELRFLAKLFGNPENRCSMFTRMRSYSQRYFSAAWAFSTQGENYRALRCILLCFFYYPFSFFSKSRLGLFLKILKSLLIS